MKVFKRILVVLCIIVIAVGAGIFAKNGIEYEDGYTKTMLIETAKQYVPYMAISTAVILLYFGIRYNEQGVLKVLLKTIIGIIVALAVVASILVIVKFQMNRMAFSIMLITYVASIIVLSAMLEENT